MGIAVPFVIGLAGGLSSCFLMNRSSSLKVITTKEGPASAKMERHTNPWLKAAAIALFVAAWILGVGAFFALASNPISLGALGLAFLIKGTVFTALGIGMGAMASSGVEILYLTYQIDAEDPSAAFMHLKTDS